MRWTIAICILLGLGALQGSTAKIHKHGTLQIPISYAADLDEGRIGAGGLSCDPDECAVVAIDEGVNESPFPDSGEFKGSDFWFESGSRKYLRPQHGARFSRGIAGSGDYKACADAAYSGNALRVDNLAAGTRVCMRTSEGRLANITIHGYNPGTLQFTVTYITWEK